MIHQALGNLVRTYNLQETYVDDADPWMGVLEAATAAAAAAAAAAFAVRSTYHTT